MWVTLLLCTVVCGVSACKIAKHDVLTDNKVSSKPLNGSEHSGQDKRIWDEGKPTLKNISSVDDRVSFSGDKCPTGQVRFNNRCVDVD